MANLQALQVSEPFSKALRVILSLVQVKNLRQGEMEIHIWRETSLVPSCPLISNIPADFHASPALRVEGGFWCFKACSPPFSFKHSREFNFLTMNLWYLHHQESKSCLSCMKFFYKHWRRFPSPQPSWRHSKDTQTHISSPLLHQLFPGLYWDTKLPHNPRSPGSQCCS